VAGGDQYVPWVHIDDVVGALLFALDTDAASGPVNVTGPQPATNKELSKSLGKALKRPAVMPVPGFAIKTLYGEMASIVTTGVRAEPRQLTELGYTFHYPGLDAAMAASV
jgi:NAD dependent epimerase/dehydratase family enzyme